VARDRKTVHDGLCGGLRSGTRILEAEYGS